MTFSEIWDADKDHDYFKLEELKRNFPEQKWIFFTDYNDSKLKTMRNKLHLKNAIVKNFFINEIHRFIDCNTDCVKYPRVFEPAFSQEKQVILLVHNSETSKKIQIKLKEKLKVEVYEDKDKDEDEVKNTAEIIRKRFENANFHLLLATSDMYSSDANFEEFVHDQIKNKKVVIGL